ncbi:MAG: hypothetical protein H0W84_08020 [Bacteroidetes bacterium]|nr:hypothetical protein [Bacteroidota bacterium]
MRYCFIYILILFSLFGFCQGFQRQYELPGSLNNTAKAVFETTPNNYIMGGLVVDTLNGIQTNRLTFFGINSQGQKTWTKKYGNSKFQYLDNNLIARWFYKQGNFLYHAGAVLDSNNNYLGVFIKIGLNGDTIWQKKFYDPAYKVYPQMVTGSEDGGFFITGFFEQTGNRPVMLIKTDINGNELWRKKITKSGPNIHDAKAIAQDSASKKIVMVGYQYIGTSNKDNVLICDSLGNKISENSYAGGGYGAAFNDLIQTKDKKFVAVGARIHPAVGGLTLTKSFIIKFDVNTPGILDWEINNFDTLQLVNWFSCVKELKNGDILVGGILDTSYMNGRPTQAQNRMTRIGQNGNIKWNRTYNYSINSALSYNQKINAINIASNGDWLAAFELINASPNPFFFVRYDSTGCDSSILYCQSLIGLNEIKNINAELSVYPNPTSGSLCFRNANLINSGPIKLKIINSLGQTVRQEELIFSE